MTKTLIDETALAKIEAVQPILRAGSWGNGTDAVCMMSAMVSGATCAEDCEAAGWPRWLAELNVKLFDAEVGADNEHAARVQFARDVAEAVQGPRDYDKALDRFLIARLDTGTHSALKSLAKVPGDWTQQRKAIERVVALLHRRFAGEDVAEEMKAAKAAAEAAWAAAKAAAEAAEAAKTAAEAAKTAAEAAEAAAEAAEAAGAAAWAAAWAAEAAAWAAEAAAGKAARAAARAAAWVAARHDLTAAIKVN